MQQSMDIIPGWDNLTDLSWKEKVAYLAYENAKLPQANAPVRHIWVDGFYIREMCIPAGATVVGREHLLGHETELVIGEVLHVNEKGERRKLIAPYREHTTPGYHVVVHTLTDIVCRTVHPNPQGITDYKVLENHIFGPAEPVMRLGESISMKRLESQ